MSSKSSRPSSARLEQAKKQKQQEQRRRYLLIGGAALALLLVVAGVAAAMLQPRQATSVGSASCDSVQLLADEGRGHLSPGDPTPVYKTVPPTSGTHNPASLPAGIYDNNTDITMLVHSLEHGYVIMYYNGISSQELAQLKAIQNQDPFKTIVAPYPNMPHKIALAAWARLQTCDGVSDAAIRSFIAQFRNQGPEPFASMN